MHKRQVLASIVGVMLIAFVAGLVSLYVSLRHDLQQAHVSDAVPLKDD